VKPEKSFFICGTARSGTTLLADLLKQTELAGDPREYFNHRGGRVWFGWDFSNYAEFVPRVIQETSTANGVFGCKMMAATLENFEKRMRTVPGNESKSLRNIMDETFNNPHYIYLFRRDRLRQAISHEKMAQSGVAHQIGDKTMGTGSRRTAHYKYYRINRTLAELAYRESLLQEFFVECAIHPLILIYEEYIENQEETIRQVMNYIGIDLPESYQFTPSSMRKMSDQTSDTWIKQYKQDRQNRWLRKLFG